MRSWPLASVGSNPTPDVHREYIRSDSFEVSGVTKGKGEEDQALRDVYTTKKDPRQRVSEPKPADSGSWGSRRGIKNNSVDVQARGGAWGLKLGKTGRSRSPGSSPSPNIHTDTSNLAE